MIEKVNINLVNLSLLAGLTVAVISVNCSSFEIDVGPRLRTIRGKEYKVDSLRIHTQSGLNAGRGSAKKSTLNPNIAKNYRRPITLSSMHSKMVETLILPDTDLFDTQFGFRENRRTAFTCNLLNGITSYFKSQNSPVFVAALDAEKCFDSICHVSLCLKLIPVYEWL